VVATAYLHEQMVVTLNAVKRGGDDLAGLGERGDGHVRHPCEVSRLRTDSGLWWRKVHGLLSEL
jgi:hypothetical protein